MTTPESIIGRTFTETPHAATPAEFLAHIRAGRAAAHGAQGSAAKWTHAAMALAIRSARPTATASSGRTQRAVLKIIERVMREGEVAHAARSPPTSDPRTRARCCARGSPAMELEVDERGCSRCSRTATSATPTCIRRARRIHERKLATRRRRHGRGARRAAALDLPRIGRRAVRRLPAGDPVRRRVGASSAARSSS